jgi:hypothetical protein
VKHCQQQAMQRKRYNWRGGANLANLVCAKKYIPDTEVETGAITLQAWNPRLRDEVKVHVWML